MFGLITALGLGFGLLLFYLSYPEAGNIPGLLEFHGASLLPGVLIGAYLVTWVWSWGKIRVHSLSGLFYGTLLVVIGTGALSFASLGAGKLFPENPSYLGHGLTSGVLHGNSYTLLRPFETGPLLITNTYVRQFVPAESGRLVESVLFDGEAQELILPGSVGPTVGDGNEGTRIFDEVRGVIRPLSVDNFETTLRGSLDIHPILRFIATGLGSMGKILGSYGRELSVRLFVMAGALSLLCAGAGFTQRGHGWPIWGPIFGLALTLGGVELFHFLMEPSILGVPQDFLQHRALGYLAPGILGGLGLLLATLSGLTLPRTPKTERPVKKSNRPKRPKQPEKRRVPQNVSNEDEDE